MRVRKVILSLCILATSGLTAQSYLRFLPIGNRPIASIQNTKTDQISSLITDTLSLPFFEDFVQPAGYPSSKTWTDNLVWVNNSFPVKAPNYGVATFDHLNAKGKPYHTLDKRMMVYADSLTSQPVNLQFRRVGAATVNYKPEDSIYFSFFVQRQGLGDAPEIDDTLMLYFKDINNNWIRQWAICGGFVGGFQEFFVPIAQYQYLTPDFQFRFVNFTKATGNLNHWHIDYIRIEKNRKFGEKSIQDVGIASVSDGLFKDYNNIPYSHYQSNIQDGRGKGPSMVVRNLNANAVQTRFQLSIYNQYQTKIYYKPFIASSRNLAGGRDTTENYESLSYDTFSSTLPRLDYTYSIDPQSNDGTPAAYNSITNNNMIQTSRTVMPWYAYDDGSAEGGFGLDYAYLGNLKGQFAMEFNTLKSDSLRGLAIYFNQSLTDVSARSFKLRIWQSLSPVGRPDNQDKLIYEFAINRPIYKDSINGFAYIFFDSVLLLPAGKYYVGWIQQMPYVLNIGYDNNYRYLGKDQTNPHLYSNLLGSWEYAGTEAKGTPMIRMLYGNRAEYAFSTKTISPTQVSIYPNPCSDYIFINGKLPENTECEIWDVTGKLQIKSQFNSRIFVGDLKPGHYILRCIAPNNQISFAHFVRS